MRAAPKGTGSLVRVRLGIVCAAFFIPLALAVSARSLAAAFVITIFIEAEIKQPASCRHLKASTKVKSNIKKPTPVWEPAESRVANGLESVGTPLCPPWVVVGESGESIAEVGAGRSVGGGTSTSADELLCTTVAGIEEEEDAFVLVVVVFAAVVARAVVLVVLGILDMRLLATAFASSISSFGIVRLSASHPALTGFRKMSSTFRNSSLQW